VLRACATAERAGVPSVAVVSDAFAGMAKAIAKAVGAEGVPLAVYPGVIQTEREDVFWQKVREVVVDQLIAGLTSDPATNGDGETSAEAPAADEPGLRTVVYSGTYDEVADYMLEQRWSDGLPVAPPTVERVEAFLRYTDRDPDEIIGVAPPAYRQATVWNTAVNGIMAGCRPEYLPVLLGVVEALVDPGFRLEDAGSTPGWEPLVIVSGPLVRTLDFNTSTGAMRMGRQANASIGRFARMHMRNVAGLIPPPDSDVDQGAIGSTFNVALAEDDDVVRGIGWQPFRVDKGFGLDDTTVTVRSVYAISQPIYSGGDHARDHLETISRLFSDAMGPWCYHAYIYGSWYHQLLVTPGIARKLAEDGFSKDDVRQFLYDNMLIEGAWLEKFGPQVSAKKFEWHDLVSRGKAPAEYAEAGEIHGFKVRQLLHPEWIDIAVAGHPGRNQSRAYVSNHNQGIPTTKRVELPAAWERLLHG
jgi:hypothetical protein